METIYQWGDALWRRSAAVSGGCYWRVYQRDVLARRLSVRGLSQEYAPRDIQYLIRKNKRKSFTKGVV
ncbi:hypothetical protein QP460_008095 [Corynebacterium amycolatum]|uniref:Uncharacterized protein n=1 Tax=Corynebacterium amycolatum TaxID=43765 RepID=A0AAW9SM09_CORAY|nr:hypothetical protein [Corynebacterium amycolatum]MDK7247170.1 hypothetical protein [Corynebacterium amycolatum]